MPINPLQALVRKETPDPGNAPAERQRHCRLPGPSPLRACAWGCDLAANSFRFPRKKNSFRFLSSGLLNNLPQTLFSGGPELGRRYCFGGTTIAATPTTLLSRASRPRPRTLSCRRAGSLLHRLSHGNYPSPIVRCSSRSST
jgi:hypothetical protein